MRVSLIFFVLKGVVMSDWCCCKVLANVGNHFQGKVCGQQWVNLQVKETSLF